MNAMLPFAELCHAYALEPAAWRAEYLAGAGGFSGANLWRLKSGTSQRCARRWPAAATPARIEFIHGLLCHVCRVGIDWIPAPLCNRNSTSFVELDGFLWEITSWLPGASVVGALSARQIANAMHALARFHLAASDFPIARPNRGPAPGILRRLKRCDYYAAGGIDTIRAAVHPFHPAITRETAYGLIANFKQQSESLCTALADAARWPTELQLCIRDVRGAHVLFMGEEVTGLVDFDAVRVDSVAADVARLLGDVCQQQADWRTALAAYTTRRPLSAVERRLVDRFDQANIAMSGLTWLEWLFVEGRQFANWSAVAARIQEIVDRVECFQLQSARDRQAQRSTSANSLAKPKKNVRWN